MADLDPRTGKPVVSSSGRFMGWNTIFDRDNGVHTPFMTRIWFGRLRLHIFHRGDADRDPHDHPWAWTTFPLTSYVEEVHECGSMRLQLVRAWRLNFRTATHTHRVLGRWTGERQVYAGVGGIFLGDPILNTDSRKIVTLVWRSAECREWGFLKRRDGRSCWQPWKEYILQGGRDAPCSDPEQKP